MVLSIRVHQTGGPDVLVCDDVALADPGPGDVLVRHAAISVDYVDIYQRSGLYPLPGLPSGIGLGAAGVIEAVGPGVTLPVGQRVAYCSVRPGAYAEARVVPQSDLLPVPESVDDATAAALMLRGVTAHMLFTRVLRPLAGDVVLVHAAAGGLGQILAAWGRRLGLRVLGTVGSAAKEEVARHAGAEHVIRYDRDDFAVRVRDLTDGRGAHCAVDGVGGAVLMQTLDAVRPFGVIASVGQACGEVPALTLGDIGPRRSLTLSRPSVMAYMGDTAAYRAAAAEVLRLAAEGLFPAVTDCRPLAQAAQAHRDLEARRTVGAVVLVP